MDNLNPRIEIANHFDGLINRIDIDIEQSIEKYKEDQSLGELKCFPLENRNPLEFYFYKIIYYDSSQAGKSDELIEWSESTKVIDYLNQIRQRTIDELKKSREESLDYLKSESCDLNHLKESKDIEEMKSRLFANKFYFQVLLKHQDCWVFNLYTIGADFYLNPSEISFLDYLINGDESKLRTSNDNLIFDEMYIFMLNISKNIRENIKSQQFPSHVINVSRQDLLNIREIWSRVNPGKVNLGNSWGYLSNLQGLYLQRSPLWDVKIKDLSSLEILTFRLGLIEDISYLNNLKSLRILSLDVRNESINDEINNDSLTHLCERCPNIEDLQLQVQGYFCNDINFEGFVNLKKLTLDGEFLEGFDFKELFENICDRLEKLSIGFVNMDDEDLSNLLNGHNFQNLSELKVYETDEPWIRSSCFSKYI